MGWLQFSPRITASSQPYFIVEGGNIYSQGNIQASSTPPFNQYNAYLIESSGDVIHNFFSSSTGPGINGLLTGRPVIDFPSLADSGQYTNVLGKIDVKGLITEVGSTGKNKYGMEIITDSDAAEWSQFTSGSGHVRLGNTVFHGGNLNTGGFDVYNRRSAAYFCRSQG